ncbi:MAG: hypothetical protein ACSLEG_00150 [Candidatus Carsonella ruddii]
MFFINIKLINMNLSLIGLQSENKKKKNNRFFLSNYFNINIRYNAKYNII